MPFFTIIIPTYNSSSTIKSAVNSIVQQTFSDLEILIIDNVSSDNTLELVRAYNDPRIKIISEIDRGIYDAMNKGIALSKGKWLYFLGSDDWLIDKYVLENIGAVILKEEPDAVYGNVFSDGLGGIYDGFFDVEKILHKNISHQALFLKRTLVNTLGIFDIRYKACADWEYNFRWFFKKGVKKIYTATLVAHFCYGGLSSTFRDDYFFDRKTILYLFYGKAQLKTIRRLRLAVSEIKKHLLAKRFLLAVRIFFKIPQLLILPRWKEDQPQKFTS